MQDKTYTVKATLTRKAKSAGGDRYEADDLNVYIPQHISRQDGSEPVPYMEITFKPERTNPS